MLKYVGAALAGAAFGCAIAGVGWGLAELMSAIDEAKKEKYIADNGLTGLEANMARVAWELNGAKKYRKK